MKVIGYNHSPKSVEGIEMKNSLDSLLTEADAISIHITHTDANRKIYGKEQFDKMKDGVIIVNVADRECVDEEAIEQALQSGKVFGYAYEAEGLEHAPLAHLDNAIGLKGFGWYTKEALENLFQIWTSNIVALANDKPQNLI